MPIFKDWIAGRSAVTIADADELYVRDSDADTSKRITWASVKTALSSTEMWLGPGMGVTTTTVSADGSQGLAAMLFVDAATSTWGVTTWIPTDWATFDAKVWHYNQSSASGDVQAELKIGNITIGDTKPSTLDNIADVSSDITVGAEDVVASTTMVTGATNPGELVGFYVRRNGTNGADTLAGTWAILGIQLTKAS